MQLFKIRVINYSERFIIKFKVTFYFFLLKSYIYIFQNKENEVDQNSGQQHLKVLGSRLVLESRLDGAKWRAILFKSWGLSKSSGAAF